MNKTELYTKYGITLLAVFVLGIISAMLLNSYVTSGDYFNISNDALVISGLSSFAALLLYMVAAIAWEEKKTIGITAIPIPLAFALSLATYNVTAGVVFFVLSYLLMLSAFFTGYNTQNMLIKFYPKLIFKSAAQMFITIFTVLAIVLSLFYFATPKAQDFWDTKFNGFIDNTIKNSVLPAVTSQIPLSDLSQYTGALSEADKANANNLIENASEQFEKEILRKVHEQIDPYKQFLPLLGIILIFGMVQLFGFFIYIGYYFLINPTYTLLKKAGYVKQEFIDVKKEIVKL
jgi:hypothetical protein